MSVSINAKQKIRGRPATGVTPMQGVRFPPDLISEIDALATETGRTRSDVIRLLTKAGLDLYRLGKSGAAAVSADQLHKLLAEVSQNVRGD